MAHNVNELPTPELDIEEIQSLLSEQLPYSRPIDVLPSDHTLVIIPSQQTQYMLRTSHMSRQSQYMLRTALISRSPVMQRMIQEAPSNTITLNRTIHQQTFHIIVGHFTYPLTQEDIAYYVKERPNTALNLIHACEYLELVPLLAKVMNEINTTLDRENVAIYIQIMSKYHRPREWIRTLEEHIVLYLVTCLPVELNAFQPGNKRGYKDLIEVYAKLPRHLVIECLQHYRLPTRYLIRRIHFAKRVLASHPKLQVVKQYDRLVIVKKPKRE